MNYHGLENTYIKKVINGKNKFKKIYQNCFMILIGFLFFVRINICKYKVSREITVAVAVILTVVSMSFGNTRAYALSKVNLLGESIASSLGINKNLEDYNTVINKLVIDNEVTIKLNEVILDENELIISTNVS